jgi:addiction module RelE/StbE family toxin
MAEIVWTEAAIRKIEEIGEFISQDSFQRSKDFINSLVDKTKRLSTFPFSGRIIPEFNDEKRRELIVEPFRILYIINNDQIIIINIIHNSQDFLNNQ